MENSLIKCSDVVCYVVGLATHYYENTGESYANGHPKQRKVKYAKPKIEINFMATVDILLVVNGVYSDGKCMFRAVSSNKIVNQDVFLDSFSIPVQLVCVSAPFSEGLRQYPLTPEECFKSDSNEN